MKKRVISLLLASVMVLSLAACRSTETTTDDNKGNDTQVEKSENYKIGILTGTASQGDEEITQATMMKEKYGEDKIVTATYPDNFDKELDQVIAAATDMASDPDVKAIVWCQAVPGTAAAIEKVRETRPDMIFIAGTPGEDPSVINTKADIVLQVNEPGCGVVIPPQAAKQGAKTMIHYSFPRHLSYALIVQRLENLKTYCAENGIELVEVNAPDPTGDAGMTGAQNFINEDVPKQVAKYGKDTVFFTTNCGMQEPLIRSVFEQGAIYTLQCCPSPFHAFPAALNIDMKGHEGDVDYFFEQMREKVAEYGMEGRVSTWAVPCNMLFIEAGVEYAMKVLDGETNGEVLDDAVLRETLQEVAGDVELTIDNYEENGETAENHYLVMSGFVEF